MVNKFIASFFFIELIIALLIGTYWASAGIEYHTISLSPSFVGFLNETNAELNQFKIEIPNIPKIDLILEVSDNESANWWDGIFTFFVNFANGFFTFINGVIVVLNFVIMLLNYLIQFVEFIAILIKNMFVMVDSLKNQSA